MSINFKTLTPTGIFSIDRAISMVLVSFERFDKPKVTWKFIRLLANTTADSEIIQACKTHSEETKRQVARAEGQIGHVYADKYTLGNNVDSYLEERNESLYGLIMAELAKRGFSQKAGLLQSTMFKNLEEEAIGPTEEETPFES